MRRDRPQASRSRHRRAGRPILSLPGSPAAPSPGIRVLPTERKRPAVTADANEPAYFRLAGALNSSRHLVIPHGSRLRLVHHRGGGRIPVECAGQVRRKARTASTRRLLLASGCSPNLVKMVLTTGSTVLIHRCSPPAGGCPAIAAAPRFAQAIAHGTIPRGVGLEPYSDRVKTLFACPYPPIPPQARWLSWNSNAAVPLIAWSPSCPVHGMGASAPRRARTRRRGGRRRAGV